MLNSFNFAIEHGVFHRDQKTSLISLLLKKGKDPLDCSSYRPIIILKWKTFGTTRTLPRAGRPAKLSCRGRRTLVREVKKNPKITVAELQRCIREMGESCRKSTITAALQPVRALWQSGPTEASPQCKTHESPHGVC